MQHNPRYNLFLYNKQNNAQKTFQPTLQNFIIEANDILRHV